MKFMAKVGARHPIPPFKKGIEVWFLRHLKDQTLNIYDLERKKKCPMSYKIWADLDLIFWPKFQKKKKKKKNT